MYIYKHTFELDNVMLECVSSYQKLENCDISDTSLIINNECVKQFSNIDTINDVLYSVLEHIDINSLELKQINELVKKYDELFENDELEDEENETFIKHYNDTTLSFLKRYSTCVCIGSLYD